MTQNCNNDQKRKDLDDKIANDKSSFSNNLTSSLSSITATISNSLKGSTSSLCSILVNGLSSITSKLESYIDKSIDLASCEINNSIAENINNIQNEINNIINGNICMKFPSAKPTDNILPIGVTVNEDGCAVLRNITFSLTSQSVYFDANPSGKVKFIVPDKVTYLTIDLQGAGGGGGAYVGAPDVRPSNVVPRWPTDPQKRWGNSGSNGGDSILYLNGEEIVKSTGGEGGAGAFYEASSSPPNAPGGTGLIISNPTFVNSFGDTTQRIDTSKSVYNIASEAGSRDWVESTFKSIGATGHGGRPLGPLGRAGKQTGFLPKKDETTPVPWGYKVGYSPDQKTIDSWHNVVQGYLGGGAGGGSFLGCSWGSGGGAGGYAQIILGVVPGDIIEYQLGEGGVSGNCDNGFLYGGNGYIKISWS